ncbi:hypothetical protein CXG81DRAFT_19540 [Caulochytrium protostelioides]|uniref:Uncharacterized protein n=1 Tax=Caulochytrium protostelioides TaxID=1555241 RepID=A0A4P9X5U5_9FUNG|nr:hypothetical protein CXG81DRAFT_19540 [Caulochytrium protostelioides]|eukprot:RKP00502.1 hypothetical protein CXG81DRAFT_19540 [Caulochytrium protostelioides]
MAVGSPLAADISHPPHVSWSRRLDSCIRAAPSRLAHRGRTPVAAKARGVSLQLNATSCRSSPRSSAFPTPTRLGGGCLPSASVNHLHGTQNAARRGTRSPGASLRFRFVFRSAFRSVGRSSDHSADARHRLHARHQTLRWETVACAERGRPPLSMETVAWHRLDGPRADTAVHGLSGVSIIAAHRSASHRSAAQRSAAQRSVTFSRFPRIERHWGETPWNGIPIRRPIAADRGDHDDGDGAACESNPFSAPRGRRSTPSVVGNGCRGPRFLASPGRGLGRPRTRGSSIPAVPAPAFGGPTHRAARPGRPPPARQLLGTPGARDGGIPEPRPRPSSGRSGTSGRPLPSLAREAQGAREGTAAAAAAAAAAARFGGKPKQKGPKAGAAGDVGGSRGLALLPGAIVRTAAAAARVSGAAGPMPPDAP